MSDYISRESVLQILSGKNAVWDAYQKVQSLPAADVVPMDFHERCLQIEIQKRIALEKADVRPVEWISVTERLSEAYTPVLLYNGEKFTAYLAEETYENVLACLMDDVSASVMHSMGKAEEDVE